MDINVLLGVVLVIIYLVLEESGTSADFGDIFGSPYSRQAIRKFILSFTSPHQP